MDKTRVVDIHKKGAKRPEFDLYIGRAVRWHKIFTEDSVWHNPFPVGKYGLDRSLELYKDYILDKIKGDLMYNIEDLRDKRLGCWCITTRRTVPLRCHGQILMRIMRGEIKLK